MTDWILPDSIIVKIKTQRDSYEYTDIIYHGMCH